MNNDQIKLLMKIANDNQYYESEYDGRVYYFCRHCDSADDQPHDPECAILQARQSLGSIWTDHQAKLAADALEKSAAAHKKFASRQKNIEKISCPLCLKKISRLGLKDHQKSPSCSARVAKKSLREHEARTGIKCLTDLTINFDGPRCLSCSKPMAGAHPNKKFCSNSGPRNCKDHYHNRTPGRIEHSKEYVGQIDPRHEQKSFAEHHWCIRADREGWDEHKDASF